MAIFSFSAYPKAEKNYQVAIVVSDFNEEITEQLLDNCFKALKKCKINPENIAVSHVSGAFEIPFIAKKLIETGEFDGVITLGAVIRGETPHFDYICAECTRGIMDLNLKYNIPVIFGVLTCNTTEQAIARMQKGEELAIALVNQLNLFEEIKES